MWENYGDRGGVERVDDRPVAAVEGDMCAGSERLTLRRPELRLVVGAEARGLPLVEGHYDPIAERAEGLLRPGRCIFRRDDFVVSDLVVLRPAA